MHSCRYDDVRGYLITMRCFEGSRVVVKYKLQTLLLMSARRLHTGPLSHYIKLHNYLICVLNLIWL